MAKEACIAAKTEGNAAYSAGALELAVEKYSLALEQWDQAFDLLEKPKTFAKGDCVVYNSKGFGRVESAFAVMDEYFLTDLGTDKPIWCGEVGVDLKRFSRSDLQPVPKELFDLRMACVQNLCAVKLKQEDYKLAIKWADEALRMDAKAPKALMRKGAALLKTGQAGPASDFLLTASEVVPEDKEVKRLLREAEKARGSGWVCASGCCGPWGVQNHMLAPPINLNTIGKGSTLGSLGPMRFGPSTAGQKIVVDEDSDSDCSGCSDPDCSKTEQKEAVKEVKAAPLAQPAAVLEESRSSPASASYSSATAPSEEKAANSSKSASAAAEDGGDKPGCTKPDCADASCGSTTMQDGRSSERAEISRLPDCPDEARPKEKSAAEAVETAVSPAASSKRFSTIAAAAFVALAALMVAWQLGNIGAMAVDANPA